MVQTRKALTRRLRTCVPAAAEPSAPYYCTLVQVGRCTLYLRCYEATEIEEFDLRPHVHRNNGKATACAYTPIYLNTLPCRSSVGLLYTPMYPFCPPSFTHLLSFTHHLL